MRMLCVDDEPLMLRMLEMAVKEARPDADITAYPDPLELLEDAKKNGCDVAFLDIHMRGMNGVQLAKELKAVNPKYDLCNRIFRVQGRCDGYESQRLHNEACYCR